MFISTRITRKDTKAVCADGDEPCAFLKYKLCFIKYSFYFIKYKFNFIKYKLYFKSVCGLGVSAMLVERVVSTLFPETAGEEDDDWEYLETANEH